MSNMALNDKNSSMAQNSNTKTREKAVFVAQQLHFANTLAGNDPVHRVRAMKKLRKYFFARANGNFSFTHDDFMRIWKGLFYCMWMSDKPLIQEELAEEISQLIHCFQRVDMAFTFARAFFDTLLIEWFGIDYHRMDKFQMFVRRFLRQCLVYCKNKNWKKVAVTELCSVLESTVLSPSKCVNECGDVSLIMHFSEIFVEELAKVTNGKFSKEMLIEFLKPFMMNLSGQNDFRLQHVIRDRVFYCLIKQSPEGLEYEEKFEAWKRAGFPGTSWKEMVFVGNEDKRSGVKVKNLDPRAGKVNVYLPHLQFDAGTVAETLREYAEKSSNKQSQRFIQKIAHKFQELAEGRYPLAINLSKTLLNSRKYQFSKQKIDDAVENLLEFNEQLKEKDKIMKKSGKRKKNASKLNNSKKMKLEKNSVNEEYDSDENIEEEERENLFDSEKHEEGINHNSTKNGEAEDLNTTVLQDDVTIHENNVISDFDEMGHTESELSKKCAYDEEAGNTSSTKIIKKGNKRHSVSSWSVFEISSLHEEDSGTHDTFKENEKENVLAQEIREEMDTKVETETDSKETLLEDKLLVTDLIKATPESNESESRVPNEDVEKSILEVKQCVSVLNGDNNVQEREETTVAYEELETVDQVKEVVTPLRRSARRKSNVFHIEESVKTMEDGKFISATSTPLRSSARLRLSKLESEDEKGLVNYNAEEKEMITDVSSNQSVTANAKRNLLFQTPAKRRLSKVETPNKVNEEEDESGNDRSSKENEQIPLPKRRSFTPCVIRGKGRISTVPDREIPNVHESDKLSKSMNNNISNVPESSATSPVIEISNGVLRNNEILNKQERSSLSPQKKFQSPQKKSPGKNRVSFISTPGSAKKVNIVLQMNKCQAVSEYVAAVRQSPSVPHDANKMPCKGVLKRTSIKSPINPFYVPPKGLK